MSSGPHKRSKMVEAQAVVEEPCLAPWCAAIAEEAEVVVGALLRNVPVHRSGETKGAAGPVYTVLDRPWLLSPIYQGFNRGYTVHSSKIGSDAISKLAPRSGTWLTTNQSMLIAGAESITEEQKSLIRLASVLQPGPPKYSAAVSQLFRSCDNRVNVGLKYFDTLPTLSYRFAYKEYGLNDVGYAQIPTDGHAQRYGVRGVEQLGFCSLRSDRNHKQISSNDSQLTILTSYMEEFVSNPLPKWFVW